MRLPYSVNIRGRNYRIRKMAKTVAAKEDINGLCVFDLKHILVDTTHPDEAAHTLLHEILHAVIHEYEIKVAPEDSDEDEEEEIEEVLVKAFENALMQVLRDNPKVVEYLRMKRKSK